MYLHFVDYLGYRSQRGEENAITEPCRSRGRMQLELVCGRFVKIRTRQINIVRDFSVDRVLMRKKPPL